MTKLIVFSDLDGILLHHDTYDWKPALPAINLLKFKQHGFPLVLTLNRTEVSVNYIFMV